MHKELIERLRYTASKGVSVWGDLQTEAAGAIEALQAENERLKVSAKYAEHIDATLENQRETMLHDVITERDTLRAALQNSITRRQEQMASSDFAVASLKEERDEYQKAADAMAWSHKVERDTLRTALTEAQRDAERYRFLFNGSTVYSNFRRTYGEWDGSDGKDGFDAVIDAAIAALKGVV